MPSQNFIRRHWGISIVLSIALHLAVLGLLCIQARKNANKEEKEIEFIPIEIIEVQSESGGGIAEPEPLPEPEPEPEPTPEPEPVAPEPEPVPVPEPEPEPSMVVEEPKKEEIKPKPVEKPKPKPVEKPKPKQPTLEERIRNARVVKGQSVKPQPNKNSDIDKRLRDIRNRTNSPSNFGKTGSYSSSGVTGVAQSEMAHYQAYNTRCVAPTLSRLWTQLGPNALDTLPNDVVIAFNIDRNGRVAFCSIVRRSNNIAMNNAAERLCDAVRNTSFPPFSQVGLKAESNVRSIPFEFTLKYQH